MDYRNAIIKNLHNKNDRKLILWSEGVLGEYIYDALIEMEEHVDTWIGGDVNRCREIKCAKSFDELEGGAESNFIFAAFYSGHKDKVEILNKAGYVYKKDYIMTNIAVYVDDLDLIDPLLTYSRKEEKYPGIVKIGECEDGYRILILGNSVSETSVGGNTNWTFFLHEEFNKRHIKNVIYNAAVSGYNSGQEFLKLCRDGLTLRPDLVISFSGVCDVSGFGTTIHGSEFLQTYQKRMWENILSIPGTIPDSLYMRGLKSITTGIENESKDFEIWLDHERKMYAICREYDVKFMGILQPMISQGYTMEERMYRLLSDIGNLNYFISCQKEFIKGVKNKEKNYSYIYNMTEVFVNRCKMYHDRVHYSEEGNRIVASYIADKVETDIFSRGGNSLLLLFCTQIDNKADNESYTTPYCCCSNG